MHFHFMTYMARSQHKNPCPVGHEIYNFDRPFFGHHYYRYILSLSDLCMGIEQKIFKEVPVIHFHYITCMYTAMPQHKNPCIGGHIIYNFGRPFLGHHFYTGTFKLTEPCPRVEEKIFKEVHQLYTFYPQITSPWEGG